MHASKRPLVALVTAVAAASLLAVSPVGAADTTLKNVMKKMGATASAEDAKGLAPLFEQTKAAAKPDYANWGAIADKGKAAAAKGDLVAAKATCKECHDAYRSDYKTKYGSKAP
jgi:hypothetical protein